MDGVVCVGVECEVGFVGGDGGCGVIGGVVGDVGFVDGVFCWVECGGFGCCFYVEFVYVGFVDDGCVGVF